MWERSLGFVTNGLILIASYVAWNRVHRFDGLIVVVGAATLTIVGIIRRWKRLDSVEVVNRTTMLLSFIGFGCGLFVFAITLRL